MVSLIFCSAGYFNSPNCMRELLRAMVTGKPIVTLLEPEAKHGGLTNKEVRQQLDQASGKYVNWGLDKEVERWGYELPTADDLYTALFAKEPIEWNRIGECATPLIYRHVVAAVLAAWLYLRAGPLAAVCMIWLVAGVFQDVSMRLIAESLLSRGRADTVQEELTRAVSYTFLQGELTRQQCVVPEPCGGCKHHIYCSSHNEGAADLMREVASHFNPELTIKVTESIDELPTCERMLVYLTRLTWTSGAASDAFAQEVQLALDAKVPLLLCHEMLGVGGQAERHGCSFELFFMHEDGATPPWLLEADLLNDCHATQGWRVAKCKHGTGCTSTCRARGEGQQDRERYDITDSSY